LFFYLCTQLLVCFRYKNCGINLSQQNFEEKHTHSEGLKEPDSQLVCQIISTKTVQLSKLFFFFFFIPTTLISAAAGDAEDGLELLENDQLKARGGGKTGPNGNKSRVQTARSVLRHDLRC